MSMWKNVVPAAEQQRQSKREALLHEAAAAFNKQGFHGTSLNDIAKKLGVTKAALYTYVPSKEDLLYFCHDWAMDGAFESLEHARGAGGTGLEKLRNTLQHYLEQMLMEGGAFVVLLEENALKPAHAKAIIKRRDEFEVALRSFVTEGIADGSIVPCNEKIAVFLALGALNWVRKWYSPEGAWSAQLIAESLTQMIERGLATAQSTHLMPQSDGTPAPI
jgi:TetR/AcrR family transcriptional regulator